MFNIKIGDSKCQMKSHDRQYASKNYLLTNQLHLASNPFYINRV